MGFAIAYVLTGSVAIASGIALIEPMANTVVFYLHERVWRRIPAADVAPGGATSA